MDEQTPPEIEISEYEKPKVRDRNLAQHQRAYERTPKGQLRKSRYYSSERGREAKKRSQENYRANKIKNRRAYFLEKLGPDPDLSILLPIQAKVLKLYYGVYDEREPLLLRELAKACGITLPMTKINLAIGRETFGLNDQDPW